MKRIAFTIIYNGQHHLTHDFYALRMVDMFDYWVVIEGAALNNGSTQWCNRLNVPANSTDGTIELMNELQSKHSNVKFIVGDGKWNSKDEMVNRALDAAYEYIGDERCILWEIDADEQWQFDALVENEIHLMKSGCDCGAVRWNHFVSHDLVAIGDWGGNLNTRLWIWNEPKQQRFITHEPPNLSGAMQPIELPRKCNHYSYFFERDVKFKSEYYGGHQNVYANWFKLHLDGERKKLQFPLHISYLFGNDTYIGNTNSFIVPINIIEYENKKHKTENENY